MRRRSFLAALATLPVAARAARGSAVFVVHPYDTPSRVYARFRPLTLWLGGVLGRPVRLVIATTYDEQIEMLATGRADYAYIGPTPYVRVRARAPVDILAGEAENGQAFYQSALVVRATSPIRQVADLAGKRIALGAEISMSSAVAPKQMLAQAGLKRTDLAEVAHLDRHERVALAVLHGDFDAGGLRLDIAKTYLPRGLRILATSQPLPPHVIAASAGVPAEVARQVRQALLHPDDTGLESFRALGPHIGFVAVEDAHFHAVRRMVKALAEW
ncbi:MAG: phosphate/phosphite/phosphonate ABC transporter substrate-binding protein [Pseudomonadota bacterium]